MLEARPAVDVCIFNYRYHAPSGGEIDTSYSASLDREGALSLFRHDMSFSPAIWCKVYRSSLCEGLQFTPGIDLGEDTPWMYEMLLRSREITCLGRVGYHYTGRVGSLSYTPSPKLLDLYVDLDNLYNKYASDKKQAAQINTFRVRRLKAYYRDLVRLGLGNKANSLRREYRSCGLYTRDVSVWYRLEYLLFLYVPRVAYRLDHELIRLGLKKG